MELERDEGRIQSEVPSARSLGRAEVCSKSRPDDGGTNERILSRFNSSCFSTNGVGKYAKTNQTCLDRFSSKWWFEQQRG